jgi:predicted metal-dependent phosphoesterase TrpH
VVTFAYMRPLRRLLQWSFGLAGEENLNYAELKYNPPYTPVDLWSMELNGVRHLGFDSIIFAITDHDNYAGGLELLKGQDSQRKNIALGEELSVKFQHHVFHLGITGLREADIAAVHQQLQAASHEERFDDLFDSLHALGCLVVLNHPLLPWGGQSTRQIPVLDLLTRFGWAIHALEYNGMRCRAENDDVLQLARQVGKPLVGGGDSHLLAASSILCASADALESSHFIEEIKSGRAIPLIKRDYYAPLGWKMFLRVLSFIAHYRKIAYYRGNPVESIIGRDWILLDPIGMAARAFLRLASALGWLR